MNIPFEIESPAGLVALWDATNSPVLKLERDDRLAAALREPAKRGSVFFIEADDPVRYRMRLLVDESPDTELEKLYEDAGGAFKLEVPSGRLVVAGLDEEAKDSKCRLPVSVPPGTFLLRVLVMNTTDLREHKKRVERLVGPRDTAYASAVNKIGLCGCLTTLLLAFSLLIPFTRRYWWFALPVLLAPSVLHLVLRALPRSRRIERIESDFGKQLPHFILLLKHSSNVGELPGGWIRGL